MNKRRHQRMLKRRAINDFIWSSIIAFTFIIISPINSIPKDIPVVQAMGEVMLPEIRVEAEISLPTLNEAAKEIESTVSATPEPENTYPVFTYSKDWDENDSYLLAKIAMCEAENQNTQTKTLVIMTILNRAWDDYFPDTIEEVIFQQGSNGVYQFSPIGDGSWEKNEPNKDCWEAVRIVRESKYDYSDGALYFESCENEDNWHSRNLEFLYQSQAMKFYK